jgi:antitoxin YefM
LPWNCFGYIKIFKGIFFINKISLDFLLIFDDNMYRHTVQLGKEERKMVQTTYTKARNNLAKLMDLVTHDNEVVVVTRKKAESVAIIAESEFRSIMETLHLISSPKNRQRLLDAYNRAEEQSVEPSSIEDLRREVGFVKE